MNYGTSEGRGDTITSTCHGSNPDEVWSFTAPFVGSLMVTLDDFADAGLALRTECTNDESELTCDDWNGPEVATLELAADETIYIHVEGYYAQLGPHQLNVLFNPPSCGDGVLNRSTGEQCDPAEPNLGSVICDSSCALIGGMFESEPNEDGSPSPGGPELGGNDFSIDNADPDGDEITTDVIIWAALDVQGDEDVFRLHNQGGSATVTLEMTDGIAGAPYCAMSIDPWIAIRDDTGAELALDDDASINRCPLITDFPLAANTTIYVHVGEFNDDATYPYLLFVDFN